MNDEVHVWFAWLDDPAWPVTELADMLGAEERARAARFVFERDRRRFIVSHGLLRRLLADYLQTEPAGIRYAYSASDKPFLADTNLQFNLSHSDARALFAFAVGHPVGVDLEKVRDIPEGVAERYFTPAELATLQSLPRAEKSKAFFAGWTRKEAYLKATGEGIGSALSAVEVSIHPHRPAALRSPSSRGWFLHHLNLADDYIGALATTASGAPVIRNITGASAVNFWKADLQRV